MVRYQWKNILLVIKEMHMNKISIFANQLIKKSMISNVENAIKKQAFSFNVEEIYFKGFCEQGEAIWQELSQVLMCLHFE